LHVAATPKVVSMVLLVEHQMEKSIKQYPVYFVTEVLHDAQSRYPNIKKSLYVFAVTNDHFQLPIIVQNRRNKHNFDTYAFTIDLIPLVFEKTCFVDHTFEFRWKTNKTKQKAPSRKRNAEMCK
jgi:proteasome assembly chaperone (PAC2) family protein